MSQAETISRWKPWHVDAGAVALLLALAAGVYWIEMSASLERHDAVIAKMRDLDTRQVKNLDIEKSIIAVQQRAEVAMKLIADAGFTLDSTQRVNERLARITELATSAGLQVEGIEPSKAVASGHLAAIAIRVTARGGYAAVSKFIHEVRDRLPDCVITSLELSATPSVQDPVANANIQIIWHTRPDNLVAGN
jgi:Tfp pilus assembly protein PilO